MMVRSCLPSDAASIEALFQEFAIYLNSIGDQTVYRFGREQYLADGFGPDPAFRGFIAEDASGPLGYVLFSRTYADDYVRSFHVLDLYVRQGSRSRGVGRLLVNAVRDTARAERIRRLTWTVHKDNARAIQFYAALGAQSASDTHAMYLDLPAAQPSC